MSLCGSSSRGDGVDANLLETTIRHKQQILANIDDK